MENVIVMYEIPREYLDIIDSFVYLLCDMHEVRNKYYLQFRATSTNSLLQVVQLHRRRNRVNHVNRPYRVSRLPHSHSHQLQLSFLCSYVLLNVCQEVQCTK